MERIVRLSVIVPAHNAAAVLPDCLGALRRSDLSADAWELIVVDDASTDGTGALAATQADRVIELTGRARGPAHARNRGAEVARGSVLVFIDADIRVHTETLGALLHAVVESGAAAVFGAYDAAPTAPGFVSQYRNLLHHYVHTQHPGTADTFWAGCGAIRRDAFMDVGGFDEARYPRPQIEDIELGYRLRARGATILLMPDIQATHLKRWTLFGMLRSDLLNRAVPWMHLLLAREAVGSGSLNIRRREKLLTAATALASVALASGVLLRSWPLLAAALGIGTAVGVANAPFFAWLARLRGAAFAVRAVPLHMLYYLLNASAVGIALLQRWLGRGSARTGASSPTILQGQVV